MRLAGWLYFAAQALGVRSATRWMERLLRPGSTAARYCACCSGNTMFPSKLAIEDPAALWVILPGSDHLPKH